MDHILVDMYDPTWHSIYRYLSMFLSIVGLFKTNFVTSTFFNPPSGSVGVTAADAVLTDGLIQGMESLRDGYHSFATTLTSGSTFVPDSTMSSIDYSTQFFFSIFTGSIFLQASLFALVCKYMTQEIFAGTSFLSIFISFFDMVVIGMIPDFAVTTVPLYLNYRRLWDLEYNST